LPSIFAPSALLLALDIRAFGVDACPRFLALGLSSDFVHTSDSQPGRCRSGSDLTEPRPSKTLDNWTSLPLVKRADL